MQKIRSWVSLHFFSCLKALTLSQAQHKRQQIGLSGEEDMIYKEAPCIAAQGLLVAEYSVVQFGSYFESHPFCTTTVMRRFFLRAASNSSFETPLPVGSFTAGRDEP